MVVPQIAETPLQPLNMEKIPEETTENQYSPAAEEEFTISIPVSELFHLLGKLRNTPHDPLVESSMKCPYCGDPLRFYKDTWYFCPNHNFIQLEDSSGRTT